MNSVVVNTYKTLKVLNGDRNKDPEYPDTFDSQSFVERTPLI